VPVLKDSSNLKRKNIDDPGQSQLNTESPADAKKSKPRTSTPKKVSKKKKSTNTKVCLLLCLAFYTNILRDIRAAP
jgi:hypothetical protein